MRVKINDDEEVEVGDDTSQEYYFEDVNTVADSAFKCPPCQTVTVHEGYEFTIDAESGDESKTKRVYLCTNCGRVTTR